jgi:hypothetical protein
MKFPDGHLFPGVFIHGFTDVIGQKTSAIKLATQSAAQGAVRAAIYFGCQFGLWLHSGRQQGSERHPLIAACDLYNCLDMV